MTYIPQDLTRHPDSDPRWLLWLADIVGGAILIAWFIAIFFVGGLAFDKADNSPAAQSLRNSHHIIIQQEK